MILLFQGGAAQQQYSLTADAGAFSHSGSVALLKFGRKVQSASVAYGFTGTSAALKAARKVGAGADSYAFTGQAASLAKGQTLSAVAGAFALTGGSAYMGSARFLVSSPDAISISPAEASFLVNRLLKAEAHDCVVVGVDAVMSHVEFRRGFGTGTIRRGRKRVPRKFSDPEEINQAGPLDGPLVPPPQELISTHAATSHDEEIVKAEIRKLMRVAIDREDEALATILAHV